MRGPVRLWPPEGSLLHRYQRAHCLLIAAFREHSTTRLYRLPKQPSSLYSLRTGFRPHALHKVISLNNLKLIGYELFRPTQITLLGASRPKQY